MDRCLGIGYWGSLPRLRPSHDRPRRGGAQHPWRGGDCHRGPCSAGGNLARATTETATGSMPWPTTRRLWTPAPRSAGRSRTPMRPHRPRRCGRTRCPARPPTTPSGHRLLSRLLGEPAVEPMAEEPRWLLPWARGAARPERGPTRHTPAGHWSGPMNGCGRHRAVAHVCCTAHGSPLLLDIG